jgi:hypothetical protein
MSITCNGPLRFDRALANPASSRLASHPGASSQRSHAMPHANACVDLGFKTIRPGSGSESRSGTCWNSHRSPFLVGVTEAGCRRIATVAEPDQTGSDHQVRAGRIGTAATLTIDPSEDSASQSGTGPTQRECCRKDPRHQWPFVWRIFARGEGCAVIALTAQPDSAAPC